MKLLQIAKDIWTVYAYVKDGDRCQVAEFLDDESKYKNEKVKMLALLKTTATWGPKRRGDFSEHLTGNIFEFKRGPKKKGPKIRVLYFYYENKIIICTHAFMKRDKTPKETIKAAEKIRTEYFAAKKKGEIPILKLED